VSANSNSEQKQHPQGYYVVQAHQPASGSATQMGDNSTKSQTRFAHQYTTNEYQLAKLRQEHALK